VYTFMMAVGIVGTSVLLALAGLYLVRRSVELSTLEAHTDVAGFIIAVIGVIYAVLLAFVVVFVWQDFEEGRIAAEQEANEWATFYRLAGGLPAGTSRRITTEAETYMRVVVEEEWETMSRGAASFHAQRLLDEVWQAVKEVDPRTRREEALYSEMLSRLDEISDARRKRLLASHHGVPHLLWAVLVGGAVITVGFTYFFGVKNVRAQALMTAALASIISLNLFLIRAFDYPFTGDLRVTPLAFERVLELFQRLEKAPGATSQAPVPK
jgi:Protein of unknown function (DUF4239)